MYTRLSARLRRSFPDGSWKRNNIPIAVGEVLNIRSGLANSNSEEIFVLEFLICIYFWGHVMTILPPTPPPHSHLLSYTRDEKMATWPSNNPKEIESIVSHFLVYPVRFPLFFHECFIDISLRIAVYFW